MKIRSLLGMGMVLLIAAEPVLGQATPKSKTAAPPAMKPAVKEPEKPATKITEADELAAIRKASQDFTVAFNKGDAHAVAALWAENGDYADGNGKLFSGRDAIEKEYAEFFAKGKGLRIQITIDSLRLLSRDAAIEDGRTVLEPAGAGMSKYVIVHVKVGDKWLMSTVRDTPVEKPSTLRDLDDMEWLIGTWVSEENGTRTESVCRWVANKSFVERSFTATHPDETTTSGIQIIGTNPLTSHVQSWTFTADGGFAIGVWTRRDNGWSAEVTGTTGKGASTTAVNYMTRLDDNAYVWQSVLRTAGGVSIPDTDEVVIKRLKESR